MPMKPSRCQVTALYRDVILLSFQEPILYLSIHVAIALLLSRKRTELSGNILLYPAFKPYLNFDKGGSLDG